MASRIRVKGSHRSSDAAASPSRSAEPLAVVALLLRQGQAIPAQFEGDQPRTAGRAAHADPQSQVGQVCEPAIAVPAAARASRRMGFRARPIRFLQFLRRQHQGDRQIDQIAQRQNRLAIGANDQGAGFGMPQQRGTDLLAVQERLQRWPVEDLLGPVRLDRRRAMELQRPAGKIQDEIAAKQPMLRVLDHGEKTDGGLGYVLA